MLVSKFGVVISTRIKEVIGRTAQGVLMMRIEEGDRVSAVAAALGTGWFSETVPGNNAAKAPGYC